MPELTLYDTYTIAAAGATKSFDVESDVKLYHINASGVVLVASMIFNSSGTAIEGDKFEFLYNGGVTAVSPVFVTFFGVNLTQAQALYKQKITAYYNGSAWEVYITSDDTNASVDVNGADIVDATVTSAKLAGSIALTKLAASGGQGYILRSGAAGVVESTSASGTTTIVGGDGTDVGPQVVGGDLTKSGATWTIANDAVTTVKILDDNVTVAKVSADLKTEVVVIACSFETGEVGAIKFKMPYPGSVVNAYAIATKAIAATDDGTVVLKDNAGTTMTLTTPIVFAASDAFGTAYDTAVTANNTFIADDLLTVLTAKTTAGGKVLLSLEILRS